MFKYIVDYKGSLIDLGFEPASCGNYKLNDIEGAKTAAANFLVINETFGALKFVYPTAENSPELCISSKINGEDATTRAADYAKTHAKVPVIDYADKVEVKIKEELKRVASSESDKYISEFNALKPKKREFKEKKKNKEVSKIISNELF